jgi:hypothetical protein
MKVYDALFYWYLRPDILYNCLEIDVGDFWSGQNGKVKKNYKTVITVELLRTRPHST